MLNPKPILVTGATGSIGSVLVKRLCEAGQNVRALVRNPDRATPFRSLPNVEIVCGDLSQPDSLRGCAEGCSLVYHGAAILSGSNWTTSRAINVTGTQALIDEAIRARVERFIYTSTIGVYGLTRADPITEKTPWSEYRLPYFTTKQEAERLVQKATDRLPVTIARLGDVFGPGQYTWTINLIEKVNQNILKPILDSESGYLNPIYIDNVIDALLCLGTHPAASGQIFNVVDGSPIRTSDYFRRLIQMAGKSTFAVPAIVLKGVAGLLMGSDILRGREALTKPGDINYLLRKGKIHPEKMRDLIGWIPAISQEEAFHRTKLWLRQESLIGAK